MSSYLNRVVIVDTGITIDKNMLSYNRLVDGYCIKKGYEGYDIISIKNNPNCINDDVGHGTGIAELIVSHNKNVELIIIKIFDQNTQYVDEELLIFTLEYLLTSNIDFDLVNLSMGLCCVSNSNKLFDVCKAYYKNNKCIISAFDNYGSISFPAAYKYVIGVTSEDFCIKANDYYVINNSSIVNVCAKGRQQMVYWRDHMKIWAGGNSYACAHVTGILSNYKKVESIDQLKIELEKNSCGYFDNIVDMNYKTTNFVSSFGKVALFPFNKEMHSLVRFSHALNFRISNIYDVKYSARVGAMTDNLLKEECQENFCIKDINDIDYNCFDSFILGHTGELYTATNKKLQIDVLVHNLLERGKNIYSFDDISSYINGIQTNSKVFIPKINNHNKYIAPFGKLYRQDKPVLGIFGTSSKQGKFTLQLKIRYNLLNKHYKICQIGTEPSSLLFGMDGVFHNGYNSGKIISQYDAVAYLNKLIYDNSRDADIVIVGAQSGIVLHDTGNLNNYYFKQIDFLFGTLPDIAILCINSFDDITTIQKAIMLLKATVDCDVIALVVYPFFYDDSDFFRQHIKYMTTDIFNNFYKGYFETNLDLPVIYPNNERDIDHLCDMIISYFKKE